MGGTESWRSIQVTPEMIDEGQEVLEDWNRDFKTPREEAKLVYQVMEAARRRHDTKRAGGRIREGALLSGEERKLDP